MTAVTKAVSVTAAAVPELVVTKELISVNDETASARVVGLLEGGLDG
jgi:hypothetical protein